MELIYLDHNATTPVLPAVLAAMEPFWCARFGNPASAHTAGRRARQALESARECIAGLLDAHPDEVIFTSGGTEANNLAILGLPGSPPGHVIASPIEHPSVAEPAAQLKQMSFQVDYLPVDSAGITQTPALAGLLRSDTRLVAVMLANNETGAIQPVGDLARTIEEHGSVRPAVHCDAVQAVGKLPVRFHELGVTTLAVSGHKFNGPKGVGALLVRRGARLHNLLWGGHQQQGRRPGTEVVPLAVGMARALELACQEMDERTGKVRALRRRFLEWLEAEAQPAVLNGPRDGGLPHTLNISFPGCRADALLMKLDLAGVACSTGSACSSGSLLPSPVLRAMGCRDEVLQSAMRFSLSHLNTEKEIDEAARRVVKAVEKLRREPPD